MLGIVLLHTYGKPILGSGGELVSFFFVVSGFLYRDKLPWKTYMWKKIKALFPTYWLVLLLYCLKCIHAGGDVVKWAIIPHLFLVQSWIPYSGVEYAFSYVGVSWFLSSLMFCYICSPVLFKLVQKISQQKALGGILIAFMVVAMFHHFDGDNSYGLWFAYISPYCRVFEYLMGMLLWRAIGKKTYKIISCGGEWVSLLGLYSYISCISFRVLGSQTCIVHVLMIGYCYLYSSKIMNVFLSNKLMMWLSQYVMFVYLTHQALILHFDALRLKTIEVLYALDISIGALPFVFFYCWAFGIVFGITYKKIYKLICDKIETK